MKSSENTEDGISKKKKGCLFYLTIAICLFIVFLLIPGKYYANIIDPMPERAVPDDVEALSLWMPRYFSLQFMGTQFPQMRYEGVFKKGIGIEQAIDKIKKTMGIDKEWEGGEGNDSYSSSGTEYRSYAFSRVTHTTEMGTKSGVNCMIGLSEEKDRTSVSVYLYRWVN